MQNSNELNHKIAPLFGKIHTSYSADTIVDFLF